MTGNPTPAVLHVDARLRAQRGNQRIVHNPTVQRAVAYLEKEIRHFAGSPIELRMLFRPYPRPILDESANRDIHRLGVASRRLARGNVKVTDAIGACDLP